MVIDRQGRLFGKINIFDFTIGLILLFGIIMGLKAYKAFTTFHPKVIEEAIENPCQKEKDKLQKKVNDFLKEHKRAKKYFE